MVSRQIEEYIREFVEVATRSTKDIPDPELRKAAFQTVLTHLLGSLRTDGTAVSRTPKVTPRPTDARSAESSRPRRVKEGPSAWVAKLIEEGFFVKPRLIGDVVNRLGEVGHTLLSKDVSYPLARLCDLRRLRRTRSGKDKKGKTVWSYTNY